MPYHLTALPVSASNIALEDAEGESYSVTLGTDTFNRTGEDGAIPILPLCGGDEYVGETVEGQWHKNWDANISTFTATVSGGTLRMTGVAAVAGTGGEGWINNHHPVPLLDELELTVSMEVPVDDTGATADRDIRYSFFVKQDKDELSPDSDNNFLEIRTDVDESGLILEIYKEVNTVNTLLASGYDYTMDTTRSTGNLEACIWRVVFNGKPGTTGATMSVYLKQAATLALAEAATENEVTGSPFDVSDLAFNIGYPSYKIRTQNVTYFGTTYSSANRAASTYLRVSYPSQFKVKYDFTEASYGLGNCQIFDGDPDTTGVEVFDEDHEFSGDPYIQNGLIRLHIDELVQYGFKPYAYYGATWDTPVNQVYPYLVTSAQALTYPSLRSVSYLSPEKVILKIRWLDSATNNTDYYIDADVTLIRGSRYIKIEPTSVYPNQAYRFLAQNSTTYRFGYIGDNGVGDDDLNISATNTTMTDNYLVAFDDALDACLLTIFTDEKPAGGNARFEANDGGDLELDAVDQTENLTTIIWLGLSPFSNNSNLFKEAESATLGGGATAVVDAAASGGQAALLDAQNEVVWYDLTAGTDILAGRYLVAHRVRDINQVASDFRISVRNTTDGVYRNETGNNIDKTVTATYAFYSTFFDVTDTDVSGGNNIRINAIKQTVTANEIYVDYILIIPIGDGKNLPQDLSHSARRGIVQHPRICER